ncbi:MAG: NTP transferase domain-containing protein [Lewinellaceae bacterium]|nr:NTP transferase domain-containing protein [Lewinellaceae bacterium]
MKIIIPMAGRGSRLRPHTLTIPKPLLPIAGKTIVQRIVEDLASSMSEKIDELAFVIGDFGKEVEAHLLAIAKDLGAKGHIFYQTQPLGTAHAILCAAECLKGHCLVAFADTLFQADFSLDLQEDGVIWVKKVADPSSFGVVKTDDKNIITEFVEKSPVFVSDLAIVGIYYFGDGEALRRELQYLLDHDIKDKGEYQLTSALENLKQKGTKFRAATIDEWLDCGNKQNIIDTNQRILSIKLGKENAVSSEAIVEDSVIIPPCFVGPGTIIRNSVIGPFVSVGNNSRITNSVIKNSVIQNHTRLEQANLAGSMIGNHVEFKGAASNISLGDYSTHTI